MSEPTAREVIEAIRQKRDACKWNAEGRARRGAYAGCLVAIEAREKEREEMVEALIRWNKSFKNSLPHQDYEEHVFELLNKRYIETE